MSNNILRSRGVAKSQAIKNDVFTKIDQLSADVIIKDT